LLKKTDEVYPHSLFRAILDGNKEGLRTIIAEYQADLNGTKDAKGETALSVATRAKDRTVALELCGILLDRGASPRARNGAGETPLISMTQSRRFDAKIAALLQSSVNEADQYGRTALMFAAEGAGLFGQRRGNLTIARALVKIGANLFVRDQHGFTALGHAIKSNDTGRNEEMIEYLKGEMRRNLARMDFDNKGVPIS
jgi:ankyrin repeat protein